jgi:signal peptidase I
MCSSKRQGTISKDAQKNRAAEIANTFEGLITALILAFLFRAFVMEAFRIPTGSMADTLKGAHNRLRCLQCGYKYSYGRGDYASSPETVVRRPAKSISTRCPSCGHHQLTGPAVPIASGDRILVLKCIYQFFEPKRWDVIVFKDPLDPTINYIKRLIGRPEEEVEIIDGDVYINGRISRKPPKVQGELWMPVYDNDYRPVRPEEESFNGHDWRQPFRNESGSRWKVDKGNPTLFRLECPAEQINTMIYDTSIGNDFRATYAYDDVARYKDMSYCSDLMVRLYAKRLERDGRVGIELSKYETHYKAWVDFSGEMIVTKVSNGKETVLDSKSITIPAINKATLVKFANVDHRLFFQFGKAKLTCELERGADGAGKIKTNIEPQVKIFGAGELAVSHVAIFRDIHYTTLQSVNSGESAKAMEGKPFKLGKDEFFVLGDNSPNSLDSRWWARPGIGNKGREYAVGTVPRDYLVGKALFVYWPSGFKPFAKFPLAIIPNFGGMRFIYGGSNNNP